MHALHPLMGRKIRVTTIDGHTHEGVLINADGHHVYLNTILIMGTIKVITDPSTHQHNITKL